MPGQSRVLDTGWRFALTEASDAHLPDYDDRCFTPVTLPHDWQIKNPRNQQERQGSSQGFYKRAQMGWYRLWFFAQEDWEGKTVRLLFDGVQRFLSVFINGEKFGGRMYGYVPFEVDISKALRHGCANLLAVCVDNTADFGDRWYSGAGIYRDVILRVDEAVHILPYGLHADNHVHDGDVDMRVHIDVQSDRATGIAYKIALCDENGVEVYSGSEYVSLIEGKNIIVHSALIRKPGIWDIAHPCRYTLIAQLWDGEACLDLKLVFTGFRQAHFYGEEGFILNGREVKLNGVNLHHDGGAAFGAAVPLIVWERRLKELKKLGVNAVRCSHNPQEARFYDLCDELGLVVIDEIYDKWVGTSMYYQRLHEADWQRDIDAMIARDRNHPCVVLWSVGNEIETQYSEQFYDTTEKLCAYVRQADPGRQVSLALIGFCFENYNAHTPLEVRLAAFMRYAELVDVVMCNYMEGYYQAMKKAGLTKAMIGSEVFSYYRHDQNTSTSVTPRSPWDDVKQNAWVAGGFVWAGIDYLGESQGWPCKGWTGCPMDSTGFLKLRAYHLKIQWSKEPMVKIGVFSEEEHWDMAVANWGFPQMVDHWRFKDHGRMMHVAVMTNCDEVALYFNNEPVRRARPDRKDHMAHFYVHYYPGVLRVEGMIDTQCVAKDILVTSDAPKEILLSCYEQCVGKLCHIEMYLVDENKRLWSQMGIEANVSIVGGSIIAMDNGDFMAVDDRFTFHYGHALLLVSVDEDICTVTCQAEPNLTQSITIIKTEG